MGSHFSGRGAIVLLLLEIVAYVSTPTALWGQTDAQAAPYSIVPSTQSPAQYGDRDAPVRREGDVLTFTHRASASRVHLDGTLDLPMTRVGETDLWTLSVRVPDLETAIITYGFVAGGDDADRPLAVWRGPEAPGAAPIAAVPPGRIREYSIPDRSLGEARGISVYLPPGHDPGQRYPVVYMTDGEALPAYAGIAEALIDGGECEPMILVGVHSGEYAGDAKQEYDPSKDYRSIEYLVDFYRVVPGVDSTRFAAHETFFVEGVARWAERKLGAALDRQRRTLFGTSNGAAFAVSMGVRHPDRYGRIIALSLGWPAAVVEPSWEGETYPRFHLAAGTLEPRFYETTRRFAKLLEAGGFEHSTTWLVSGHDALVWHDEFAAALCPGDS